MNDKDCDYLNMTKGVSVSGRSEALTLSQRGNSSPDSAGKIGEMTLTTTQKILALTHKPPLVYLLPQFHHST